MRKAQAKKLPLAPDPRYNDKLVTRFVNNIMWEGKKSVAFDIFYNALDRVSKQTGEEGYEIWRKALSNVTPAVEVRSRRIGGATFQIPSEVRPDRKISLSIKWLIRYSRERNGRSMADKLANE
ncbi:MAG: 30S ribosomal protein S7, partial [Chitinophagaceae bacterium]